MRSSFILGLAAIAAQTLALPTDHIVHDRMPVDASDWVQGVAANPEQRLNMKIGLKQSNLDNAFGFLMDVSNPKSSNYGQYWDAEKVADTFAPSPSTIFTVQSWLTRSGIDAKRISQTQGRGWLAVDLSVAEAEKLLQTKYYTFSHAEHGSQLAVKEYSVPAYIADHVDVITPTVHVSSPLRYSLHVDDFKFIADATLASCSNQITLDCLRDLYGIPDSPDASPDNSYGIPEMDGQSMNPDDLEAFLQRFRPEASNDQLIAKLINGGKYPSNPTIQNEIEAALDLEYAAGLTFPVKTTLYQVGGQATSVQQLWDTLDSALCNSGNTCTNGTCVGCAGLTNVISISYGTEENQFTTSFMQRQCNEYMKMGLQGSSVLYASGDSGVAGRGDVCLGNGNAFSPSFPASCPYITSVGATMIPAGGSTSDPEVAAKQQNSGGLFASGGGFSNTFDMPDYQQDTVSQWLQSHSDIYPAGTFNNSGNSRAYPDISANGKNYVIVAAGQTTAVSGTSASAPLFGSVLTLINSALLQAGKPTIGFANPFIYQHPDVFNDVTSGNNPGCGTNGFDAEEGWDPVTGFGTPNYQKMLDAWMNAS